MIRTDVGAAGFGDNFVRGRSVRDALFGRASRWSLLMRFVDGPELDPSDAAFLEDVLVATVAPDPRIWPIKVAWLVGAYGEWSAGNVAAQTTLAGTQMLGSRSCAAAFPTVSAFVAMHRDGGDFAGRVVAWVRARWDAGESVWGFGVAGGGGRPRDERVALVDRAALRHGRAHRPHYRASMDAAAAISAATGRHPNLALPSAAIGLDLGLDETRLDLLMLQLLEPQLLGNAYESARIRAPSLQELSGEHITYQGLAPRRSPRSKEARCR